MKTDKQTNRPATKAELAFDVVCGMEVDKASVSQKAKYHDVLYYFCSSHCKQHFENKPDRYVWE